MQISKRASNSKSFAFARNLLAKVQPIVLFYMKCRKFSVAFLKKINIETYFPGAGNLVLNSMSRRWPQ
jgi:hypothetical protein